MEVVPRCEVLDRDAVGREHLHPVGALESAVDDRPAAIEPPDREVRRRDRHRLPIDPGRDQDHPARLRVIDGGLDRVEVLRHADGSRVPGRHGFPSGSHTGRESGSRRATLILLCGRDRT